MENLLETIAAHEGAAVARRCQRFLTRQSALRGGDDEDVLNVVMPPRYACKENVQSTCKGFEDTTACVVDALRYIWALPFIEAEENVKRFGRLLVEGEPRGEADVEGGSGLAAGWSTAAV